MPVLGCCALVASVCLRRVVPSLDGAAWALAWMVAFTTALLAVHIVPGALGLLRPGFVLGAAVVLALIAFRSRVPAVAGGPSEPEPLGWVAALGALLVAGAALAFLREVVGAPPIHIDSLNFQLPIPTRWLQADSLWGLHQFFPEYSNATYPHHGNLLAASVMLPFDSAFLARLTPVPYWAMTGVGVYAVAAELGARRADAALAGAAVIAMPVVMRAGLDGVQTDPPMLASLAAGALFLLRFERTGHRGELVVAGVALGLCLGSKWYALTTLAVVLAVWAFARTRERRHAGWRNALRQAGVVRHGALLLGLIVLAGGFWLLRNLVDTGNPVFPQRLPPLFDAPPDRLREIGGFTLADYATDFAVWREFLIPAFRAQFGLAGGLLALGWLAGVVLAARGRMPGRARAVAVAALALALAYAVTPYSAFGPEGEPFLAGSNTRYGLPALMAAAAVAAWATGRLGRGRIVFELALVLAIAHGADRALDPVNGAELLAGVVAAGALVVAARRIRPSPALIAASALAVLLAVAVVARERSNDQGYARFEPAIAWVEANAASGHQVGLAGLWTDAGLSPVFPAFGPRLGNTVRYVGEFREHLLQRYEDPQRFVAALRGLDLLIVGRGRPPLREGVEERWALDAGWVLVAQSPRLAVLRAPG